MSTLRFRFTRDPGFTPSVIRWYTGFRFDHIEYEASPGIYLGARPNGGVMLRTAKSVKVTEEAFATLEVPRGVEMLFRAFLREQTGKKYDWAAIASFGIGRDWSEQDSWICSELIAAGLQKAGWPLFNEQVKTSRIAPRDIGILAAIRWEK